MGRLSDLEAQALDALKMGRFEDAQKAANDALNMGRFGELEKHWDTVNKLKRSNRDEVIDFVAENSYINGHSFKSLYGEDYSQWFNDTMTEFDQLEKELSMTTLGDMWSLKRRNKNLQVAGSSREPYMSSSSSYNYYDDYSYSNDYYSNDYYSNDYSSSSYYEDEPSAFEEAMEKAGEKLGESVIEWGFDKDVVDQWLNNKESAWTDLMYEQDKQSTEMAQNDIKEAAAYMKGIFDNMVTDLKEKSTEAQSQISDELDSKV